MLISIVIPIYNVENFLERCLDSVINQSYMSLEIILVDDGSTDSCGAICDKYAAIDSRVIVIHKKNEGLAGARNTGMSIMKGKYVYFLDSDDYIELDAIKILVEKAQQSNADIVIGNKKIIYDNGKIINGDMFDKDFLDINMMKNTSEKFKYFFGKSYGTSACNKLYKTSYISYLNLIFENTSFILAEDLLFNLKLFINYPKIELVNEFTYYYVRNKYSITSSYKSELAKKYINLVNSFIEYANKINKRDDINDLLAFLSYSIIDSTCLNVYRYSQSTLFDIKKELLRFKESTIINSSLKALFEGRYIDLVHRNDWKYYVRLFSLLYSLNFLNIASFLMFLRFKLKIKKVGIHVI